MFQNEKKISFFALGFFTLGLNFAEFHEIGDSRISNFLFRSFFWGFSACSKGFSFGFGCAKLNNLPDKTVGAFYSFLSVGLPFACLS